MPDFPLRASPEPGLTLTLYWSPTVPSNQTFPLLPFPGGDAKGILSRHQNMQLPVVCFLRNQFATLCYSSLLKPPGANISITGCTRALQNSCNEKGAGSFQVGPVPSVTGRLSCLKIKGWTSLVSGCSLHSGLD